MSGKIITLNKGKIHWRTLLHQMLECDDVEAVVMAVRVDGRWGTCWSKETMGGLGMATMKLFRDVSDVLEEESEG